MIWPALAVLLAFQLALLVAVLRLRSEVRQLRERVNTFGETRRVNWPDPPVLLRQVMIQDR